MLKKPFIYIIIFNLTAVMILKGHDHMNKGIKKSYFLVWIPSSSKSLVPFAVNTI